MDSNSSVFKSKNQIFFRIIRFEKNWDETSVKNCKVGKTNGSTLLYFQ